MWWSLCEIKSISSANLIWSPWIEKEILNIMPSPNKIIAHFSQISNPIYSTNSLTFSENKSMNKEKSISGIRNELMNFRLIKRKVINENSTMQIYNHIEGINNLCDKKWLLENLNNYLKIRNPSILSFIPVTFHVKDTFDPNFTDFLSYYNSIEKSSKFRLQNLWIIKPGEDSNRGRGIFISSNISEIKSFIQCASKCHTYIIQKYIENPLLIDGRKFDIRCYCLISSINDNLKGILISIFL